jgi:hypothetical protein
VDGAKLHVIPSFGVMVSGLRGLQSDYGAFFMPVLRVLDVLKLISNQDTAILTNDFEYMTAGNRFPLYS